MKSTHKMEVCYIISTHKFIDKVTTVCSLLVTVMRVCFISKQNLRMSSYMNWFRLNYVFHFINIILLQL